MNTGIFLTNGHYRTYPQGYQFGDNFYCPNCVLPCAFGITTSHTVIADTVEQVIERIAKNRGIDYSDEYSYDSDVFPKAVTDLTETERCDRCNVDLTTT